MWHFYGLNLMGIFFTIFFLEFLLMIGCHGKPKTVSDLPNVRFTLDGHKFQISFLTTPMSDVEDRTETETPSPITEYAVINEAPLHDTPVKLHKKLQAFNKMKKLYEDFGVLLRLHENEMLSLLDNEATNNVEEPKSKDGGIRVRINSGENTRNVVPEIGIQEGRYAVGGHKDKSGDNLSIQVHAEPPLRMRTFLGYPKKPGENRLSPFSGRIRIYPRGMRSSQAALDSPNESTVNESAEQSLPTEEESFLRRGSELLLSMWKRFQRNRIKSTPDDQQRQNFNEELVNKDYS